MLRSLRLYLFIGSKHSISSTSDSLNNNFYKYFCLRWRKVVGKKLQILTANEIKNLFSCRIFLISIRVIENVDVVNTQDFILEKIFTYFELHNSLFFK